MKKIVITTLHLGYGGIEQYLSSLCQMLEDDYEIEIISIYKLYNEPSFYFSNKIKIKYLLPYGPNKEQFKKYKREHKYFKMFLEGLDSIKILCKKRLACINAIKNLKCDYLITTRLFETKIANRYCPKHIYKICTEHNYPVGKYMFKLKMAVSNFDKVVFVSDKIRKMYQDKLNEKCITIPNTIGNDKLKQSKLKDDVLISIGRFEEEKGFTDLIDIMSLVKIKIPSVKLFLVGNGSLKEEIDRRIRLLNLNNNVILTGYLNKDDINNLFVKSSLYVMTSYRESFGLVLLEAAACGVPAIAFDSATGARELLGNNRGILIKNRDKEAMADKIVKLLKDKKKLNELANNSKELLEDYSMDKIKKEWLKVLR